MTAYDQSPQTPETLSPEIPADTITVRVFLQNLYAAILEKNDTATPQERKDFNNASFCLRYIGTPILSAQRLNMQLAETIIALIERHNAQEDVDSRDIQALKTVLERHQDMSVVLEPKTRRPSILGSRPSDLGIHNLPHRPEPSPRTILQPRMVRKRNIPC